MLAVNNISPSRYITFALQSDENWEHGDSYTWRAKFVNSTEPSVWGLMADYADGTTEFVTSDVSGDGWHEINFVADSTKEARRVYGYLNVEYRPGTTTWADSIMLIRNRVNQDRYRHRYQQHKFVPKNPVKETDEEEQSTDGDENTGA